MKYQVHYLIRFIEGGTTRCGISRPKSFTHDTTKITCKTCKKLLEGEVK